MNDWKLYVAVALFVIATCMLITAVIAFIRAIREELDEEQN